MIGKEVFYLKYWIAIILAGILFLTGCNRVEGSQRGSSSAAPTASQAATYPQEELEQVLEGCNNFAMGTAGCSLKAMAAAAGVVDFSARYALLENEPSLTADLNRWLDNLTREERENLKANWAAISQNVQAILKDRPSVEGLLSDAGVAIDFSQLDLTYGARLAELLDAQLENEI